MEILLFRAALAPSVVLLASVVARRLGPRRGGRLLGAPTTSGPFLLLVCAEYGPGAAVRAAQGSVAGQLVVAAFCLVYGRLAARARPARALAYALLVSGAAAGLGVGLSVGLGAAGGLGGAAGSAGVPGVTALLALTVVVTALLTWPAAPPDAGPPRRPRAWDAWETPLRMALSGATVVGAVAAAGVLGSYAGGVLCSLPVLLAVMAPAVHRTGGPGAAADLLRGALSSTAGTVGFLLVLAVALPRLGVGGAFLSAVAGLLVADQALRAVLARARPRMP
ncbi:hypothetical protein DVA86_21320 [Streptomyces armeniacus]|uniref:Uncharacterized protein n=1 Tax=Streptomyces armeniacus TaxID=83291 RepID=A0A345XT47_9ACTN|nr:hypothetical protein [Streptomyces armeniacus]AXK34813.1 hypothetical protein DVA86_21320 [Streptomyces armeniacus]